MAVNSINAVEAGIFFQYLHGSNSFLKMMGRLRVMIAHVDLLSFYFCRVRSWNVNEDWPLLDRPVLSKSIQSVSIWPNAFGQFDNYTSLVTRYAATVAMTGESSCHPKASMTIMIKLASVSWKSIETKELNQVISQRRYGFDQAGVLPSGQWATSGLTTGSRWSWASHQCKTGWLQTTVDGDKQAINTCGGVCTSIIKDCVAVVFPHSRNHRRQLVIPLRVTVLTYNQKHMN